MRHDKPLSKVRQHYSQLKHDRQTWEPYWREVKEFIAPQRGRFLSSSSGSEVNDGARNDRKRINGVASRALGILASGIQSGLTSKARQWFLLTHPDPDLNRYKPVREWYDKVQDVLEGVFRRSNIYSALLHTYYEMAGFGNGAVAVMAHPSKTLFCRPFTVGSYYLSTDQWNDVDAFFYVEWLTARQMVQKYGYEQLPNEIRQAYDSKKMEERFETVNAVLKHPGDYGLRAKEGLPVVSVHFTGKGHDADGFLRVAGYRSFPVMTPRWDVIDTDVYGWAPTRDIMGDVKMLQSMEVDGLKGIAKTVDPPMRIPASMERRGLDTRPGGLNPVETMGENAVAPLYASAINLQQLQLKIQSVQEDIKEGLYNSLFLALLMSDNPQMTAREVAERHEEKLLMLGPVLERIHYELLDPLIDRAFSLAVEEDLIPPPPEELENEPTQIEYVSILSQAQKAVGISRIEQSVQFLANLVAVYPEVRHALDPYKTFEVYGRALGVRAECFRGEKEYGERVQAEQQKEELAQGAAVGEQLANSAAVMNDVNPANLKRLFEGGMGGPVF